MICRVRESNPIFPHLLQTFYQLAHRSSIILIKCYLTHNSGHCIALGDFWTEWTLWKPLHLVHSQTTPPWFWGPSSNLLNLRYVLATFVPFHIFLFDWFHHHWNFYRPLCIQLKFQNNSPSVYYFTCNVLTYAIFKFKIS